MAKVKVTQKRNNTTEITISGELNIYSAMDVYQEHFQSITFKEQVIFKLSGITEIDTSGMQILLMLFKEVEKQNAQYLVQSTNDTISEYSNLFNIQHYFQKENDALLEDSK